MHQEIVNRRAGDPATASCSSGDSDSLNEVKSLFLSVAKIHGRSIGAVSFDLHQYRTANAPLGSAQAGAQRRDAMEITTHDFWTVLHGMGFGALFMLAFSGALAELYRMSAPGVPAQVSTKEQTLVGFYLTAMVILAWATVFSGAYVIYPWYRAVPPAGLTELADYPRSLLLSSGRTSEWHNVGMEWKEHVAWLAPIAITMVAYVTMKYGRAIVEHRSLRTAVLGFAIAAFFATAVAGAFGAFLNKYAPVRGGSPIVLMKGEHS